MDRRQDRLDLMPSLSANEASVSEMLASMLNASPLGEFQQSLFRTNGNADFNLTDTDLTLWKALRATARRSTTEAHKIFRSGSLPRSSQTMECSKYSISEDFLRWIAERSDEELSDLFIAGSCAFRCDLPDDEVQELIERAKTGNLNNSIHLHENRQFILTFWDAVRRLAILHGPKACRAYFNLSESVTQSVLGLDGCSFYNFVMMEGHRFSLASQEKAHKEEIEKIYCGGDLYAYSIKHLIRLQQTVQPLIPTEASRIRTVQQGLHSEFDNQDIKDLFDLNGSNLRDQIENDIRRGYSTEEIAEMRDVPVAMVTSIRWHMPEINYSFEQFADWTKLFPPEMVRHMIYLRDNEILMWMGFGITSVQAQYLFGAGNKATTNRAHSFGFQRLKPDPQVMSLENDYAAAVASVWAALYLRASGEVKAFFTICLPEVKYAWETLGSSMTFDKMGLFAPYAKNLSSFVGLSKKLRERKVSFQFCWKCKCYWLKKETSKNNRGCPFCRLKKAALLPAKTRSQTKS